MFKIVNVKSMRSYVTDKILQINKNIRYIHFYPEQQKNLPYTSHFLNIDDEIYNADIFYSPYFSEIIQNNNSTDILNFNNIISTTTYTNLNIDKAVIFYINTPSPGHELASLIESIYLYYTNNLFDYDIVVSHKIIFLGKIFTSILDLFFDKKKIKIVDNNTIVNINKTYLIKPETNRCTICDEFLLNKLDENSVFDKNLPKNTYENLCIIKTSENKIFHSKLKSFHKDYNLLFEEQGFKIIKPEELTVSELYYLIKNCKNLILSWGAVSWCNGIFVNKNHNLIKGGGGAHTREKIVATASNEFVCIVDESKLVGTLGNFPLPLEVMIKSRSFVAREIVKIGGVPELRKDFITDQGNQILDVSDLKIIDPLDLEQRINLIPGVLDNGLFANCKPQKVIVGKD